MKIKMMEATNGPLNWGKFMVMQFTEEWGLKSAVSPGTPLLSGRGWGPQHFVVFDLQTGEGGVFRHGGSASSDLKKHAIWVCPLFEPFLEWLYAQDLSDLDKLPAHIDLPEAEFRMSGYRRPGPLGEAADIIRCLLQGGDGEKLIQKATSFVETHGENLE